MQMSAASTRLQRCRLCPIHTHLGSLHIHGGHPAARRSASALPTRQLCTEQPGTSLLSATAATAPSAGPRKAAGATTSAAGSEAREAHLQLYNTLTRQKERFTTRPETPNAVQMYVCGVTVYDYSHIGHARVYVAFDVLYRLLSRTLKYDVQYVRNFTDVDDKILARAAERQEDPRDLASRFIDEFHTDMASLNCLSPTSEPRATDYITEMCDTIGAIIANGHGYATEDGDVWFQVDTLPGYGALSGRSQEDNRAGERVAVDSRKRGPADFALWKHAKPGEVSWPSPWGPGRPGWHIECSAMIHSVMGSTIDIHGEWQDPGGVALYPAASRLSCRPAPAARPTDLCSVDIFVSLSPVPSARPPCNAGGQDLVFPHHENELAQSRAAAGPCGCGHDHGAPQPSSSETLDGDPSTTPSPSARGGADGAAGSASPFVRYWVHNGFVNVDSEKMSKSLGNFFTIRDVIQRYHPLSLRWFLVSTHYRQPVNYTLRAVEEAGDRFYYVLASLRDAHAALLAAGDEGKQALAKAAAELAAGTGPGASVRLEALGALLDDLNSPSAVASVSAPLKTVNDLLTTKAGKKQAGRLVLLAHLALAVEEVLDMLGLQVPDVGAMLEDLRRLALVRAGLSEADVQTRIDERTAARQAKDFARSDVIRLDLEARGVLIMDTAQGTSWRPGGTQQADGAVVGAGKTA